MCDNKTLKLNNNISEADIASNHQPIQSYNIYVYQRLLAFYKASSCPLKCDVTV